MKVDSVVNKILLCRKCMKRINLNSPTLSVIKEDLEKERTTLKQYLYQYYSLQNLSLDKNAVNKKILEICQQFLEKINMNPQSQTANEVKEEIAGCVWNISKENSEKEEY